MLILRLQDTPHVWLKDRFPISNMITEDVARLSIPSSASAKLVSLMIHKIEGERTTVKNLIKGEVERLMRLGAEITNMSYYSDSPTLPQPCITPRNMRTSFCQDGSPANIKRIHWIFNQLPFKTHEDVLMGRLTHCDSVVSKVMKQMNITWAPKKEGETVAHTNCIAHLYSRILCEKRQIIIKKGNKNTHNCVPFVRSPRLMKGISIFYCTDPVDGTSTVSLLASLGTGKKQQL